MQNSFGLGPLITVYQTRRLQFHHFWGLILSGIIFVLIPIAVGLYSYYSGYTQYGPAAGYAWGNPWLVFTLIMFVVWLVVLGLRLKIPRYKIRFFKNGMQFDGFPSAKNILGSEECLDWEALSGISVETIGKKSNKGQPTNEIAIQKVRLFLSNGKKITLSETRGQPGGLIDLPELVSRVKASLYPRLVPKYKSAFHEGQWLSFGPVLVQKQGLYFQTRPGKKSPTLISWNKIQHITVKTGYVVVELGDFTNPANHQKRIPVSQIPNLELLLQLIKENVEG